MVGEISCVLFDLFDGRLPLMEDGGDVDVVFEEIREGVSDATIGLARRWLTSASQVDGLIGPTTVAERVDIDAIVVFDVCSIF